ncbi:DHA2 family efflux MFS transporter permease subunit [Methanobrevibacter sp.]|uniref:DHA2 family efflux MFS transporter permease subunit n=1 Tax=Methanobrevibacter sp. TaxID=66852 RepID=UPI0025E1CE7F|nr:DHA2 family efflux MFS transporter permease subunit [Methanobrevibacter sp.]MEE0025928.1 DHA2 family efflux MFS transporter permease subunit [Methanobrevibacter sp.]
MNLTKENIALIIFIITATILSTAQTIVTTGLTGIMADFHVSSTTVQWIYSSFLLVLGVMIPTSAYIARKYKIRNIIITCLIVFLIGSIICYIAPVIDVLIIGRIIQGIGGGILLPITQIVILKVIPKEKWHAYMGLFGFIIGIAPALAPTVGGIIIDSVGWREIFLLFIIISIVLIIISALGIKLEFDREANYNLDIISLILCSVACLGIMIGFSNIAARGFSFVYVILPIIIGIITLILFSHRQFNIKNPLLDLGILKHKYFFYGTLFSAILYFTMCALNVIMPLFVQNVSYYSATESGLILLPATIIMIIFNFVGSILAMKIGVRKVLIISCILSIIGYLIMMTYDMNSSINYMMITQIIRAIGAGLALMPCVTWTISVVSGNVEDATAINNTVRQIIGAIGSAVAVVIMAIFAGGNINHNAVSVNAFGETSLVMAFLAIVMLVIVILFIHDNVEKEEIE